MGAKKGRSTIDPMNFIGKKFGLLEIKELVSDVIIDKRGKFLYQYICKCDCGNICIIRRINLFDNHTRSCGCLKKRKAANNPGWTGYGELSGWYWNKLKNHAVRASRTLEFSITIEYAWELYLKQNRQCALTGWNIDMATDSRRKSKCAASLDRIDSNIGYIVGNIQWVHKDVNQIKWTLSNERLFEVCLAIVQNKGINEKNISSSNS